MTPHQRVWVYWDSSSPVDGPVVPFVVEGTVVERLSDGRVAVQFSPDGRAYMVDSERVFSDAGEAQSYLESHP